ncbi:hypothetical protein PI124_g14517 [Phytophthora idaei]|nr:hypothetical protein PI124_g14517 [Phytophthora idaei]
MKDGFTITPFPDLRVSNTERQEMIDLVDNYVEDYIDKYKSFIVNDKCKVNKRRWQHVKSRDKLHVASTYMDVWEPATHEVKDFDACSAFTTFTASSTYTFLDSLTSLLDGIEL